MLTETNLMAVRRLTGLSSTYMDAIYTSFVTMRGSGVIMNEDFSNGVVTLTNYTRTNKMTLTGGNTSSAAVVKTWGAVGGAGAATADIIIVAVGRASDGTTEQFGVGSTTTNNIHVNTIHGGANAPAVFRDGVPNLDAADMPATPSEPAAGTDFAMIGVRDQGTEIYANGFSITNNADLWNTTKGSAAGGSITPVVNTMAIVDFEIFYGAMMFAFAAGGLPATWKADMQTMARTLIKAKS